MFLSSLLFPSEDQMQLRKAIFGLGFSRYDTDPSGATAPEVDPIVHLKHGL
jgi:hypothetical protein